MQAACYAYRQCVLSIPVAGAWDAMAHQRASLRAGSCAAEHGSPVSTPRGANSGRRTEQQCPEEALPPQAAPAAGRHCCSCGGCCGWGELLTSLQLAAAPPLSSL